MFINLPSNTIHYFVIEKYGFIVFVDYVNYYKTRKNLCIKP